MCVHETADGRRLLVIHGDFFDHLTKHAAWVYHLGDRAYTLALHLNKWMNIARRSLGYPYWSFSSLLKSKVKRAVNFINDFEHFVARYTKRKGCTGVICGHIHVPAIRRIDGIDYFNCGDWMEHCTVLSSTSTAGSNWSITPGWKASPRCRRSRQRMTESRSRAKGGRADSSRRCLR